MTSHHIHKLQTTFDDTAHTLCVTCILQLAIIMNKKNNQI